MGHVAVHQDEFGFGQDETIGDLEEGMRLSDLTPISLRVLQPSIDDRAEWFFEHTCEMGFYTDEFIEDALFEFGPGHGFAIRNHPRGTLVTLTFKGDVRHWIVERMDDDDESIIETENP